METTQEHFVKSLQEGGLANIRTRKTAEYCAGYMEFETKEGVIFLVHGSGFDFNIRCDKEEYLNHLQNQRNKLNRQISTLKKANLQQ